MEVKKMPEGSSVALDLIRGISVQLVVVGHGISFFGIFTFLHKPNFPWMQNIAVLIFFLLSGFVITYSTIRKKQNQTNYSFSYYFIDRFSRIYTAFIPALFFVFFLDMISKMLNPAAYKYSAFNVKTFIGNIFMLQDFPILAFITSFGSARPFWTLAVEWWIYLLFGYTILKFLTKNKTNIITLINQLMILALFAIVPLYNFIGGRGHGLTVYWIFGAVMYLITTQNLFEGICLRKKVIFLMFFLGLAILRVAITMEGYDPVFAFALAITFLMIIDISSNIIFSSKIIKLIRFNASFSYTLYLVHYSILDFLSAHFRNDFNPYLLFSLGFIASNIISILLGRYTEIILKKKVRTYLYKVAEK
ncbi:MAG: acyltransferase [Gammaproteobacteria bacterium]|nr:acyltransferase [Gammaproteobacteria bacterium]